jgi:hypothetical protein
MDTLRNLRANLYNLFACVCETFQYALTFLRAILCSRWYWPPNWWQSKANSLLASSRSLRTNAHGHDLLQVFASYGLCSQSSLMSGKTLLASCSQLQSRDGIVQLSAISGDGSRVEKVVDLRFPKRCRT